MILALVTVGCILALALLIELACRFWVRYCSNVYVWKPFHHVEMDVDPTILPNQSKHARFQTNRLGARGEEPPTGGKVYRILTCGGSGVECASLDQSEAWGGVAEALLNQPEHRARLGVEQVHLANIGKSGFTTDALCYTLPRILPRFAPLDLITFMIGTSAVNTWTKYGTPSVPPPPDPPWEDLAWHPAVAFGLAPRRTGLAEVARRVRHWFWHPVIIRRGSGKGLAKSRAMRRNAREIRDSFGDPTQWLQHYEQSLTRAIEIARPFTKRVVLIRQPWFDKELPTSEEEALFWHGSVGDASVAHADVFYSHRVMCELMRLVDEATVRVGVAANVEVWRPAEVLIPSPTIFYDHFHFATEGARIMGDYVARRVLELGTR